MTRDELSLWKPRVLWLGCLYMPKQHKPTGNTDETLQNMYEETEARLQKIENASYKVVSICRLKFRKYLRENSIFENERSSHPYVKNSPINIRDAFSGGKTENFQNVLQSQGGEKIHYVDVISLFHYICKYSKFPLSHPKVYLAADCPLDSLHRERITKCKILLPRKLHHSVFPYTRNYKLMFPLCSACVD